ncbi:hypothetical protein D3C76_1534990 [compost metagenome]
MLAFTALFLQVGFNADVAPEDELAIVPVDRMDAVSPTIPSTDSDPPPLSPPDWSLAVFAFPPLDFFPENILPIASIVPNPKALPILESGCSTPKTR